MNCKFTNVLVFAVGAAIGSAVTWKILNTKYEKLIQEEIESIKEAFCDDQRDDIPEDEEPDGEFKQINWDDLEDLKEEMDNEESEEFQRKEYKRLADNYTGEKGGVESMAKEPYVIAPYDFGELDGYSQVELTYYADGILEDEDYNIVNDADELIGRDSLNTFGEYEDDAVFVRNEHLQADFQILKDYRTYAEARSSGPSRVNNE